jgi:hypothetical protein
MIHPNCKEEEATHVNILQYQSLIQLQSLLKECSYFDLVIRINGSTKIIQGDFLKPLLMAIPVYDAPMERLK